MKILIVATLLVGGATAMYGQAFTPQVDFNNNRVYQTAADRDVYVYGSGGGRPLVGTQYLAQLYYGRDAGSLQPVTAAPATFRDAAQVPTSSPAAGTWIGGTRVLTGFNAGEIAILQVRVWDSTTGADFASARSRGQSMTFTYTVPPAGALPSAMYLEGFRSFAFFEVPEPSMIGLSAIAVGALLMVFRHPREKHRVG
jgi:hypothetical protein